MDTMFSAFEAWVRARLGKFTSSENYRILVKGKAKGQVFGADAMKYIYEVYGEILTGLPSDESSSYSTIKAFEWGKSYEYEAGQEAAKYLGVPIKIYGGNDPEFFLYNSFSGGSPDGIVNEEAVLEIKCPMSSYVHAQRLVTIRDCKGDFNAWLADNEWKAYVQLQFNMMCCKLNKGYFVSYDPRATTLGDNRLIVAPINQDTEIQKELDERLQLAGTMIGGWIEQMKPLVILATKDEHGTVIIEKA